jgi:hypothetical protein
MADVYHRPINRTVQPTKADRGVIIDGHRDRSAGAPDDANPAPAAQREFHFGKAKLAEMPLQLELPVKRDPRRFFLPSRITDHH